MPADDAQHRREPEPAAGELGGEKGIEQLGSGRLVHSAPGVAHDQFDEPPRRRRAVHATAHRVQLQFVGDRRDRHRSGPVADRLARVDDEVHQHLPQLAVVAGDRREPRGQVQVELHLLRQREPEQLGGLDDEGVEVDRPEQEPALAGVREQLPRQPAGLGDPADDGGQVVARRVAGGQRRNGQFGVPEYPGEQVVEVVGHAAGQNAERLQALRVLHLPLDGRPLLLRPAPLGQVDPDGLELAPAVGGGDEPGRPPVPPARAVQPADQAGRARRGPRVPLGDRQVGDRFGPGHVGDELRHRRADELAARDLEQPTERLVDEGERPVRGVPNDGGRGPVHQRLVVRQRRRDAASARSRSASVVVIARTTSAALVAIAQSMSIWPSGASRPYGPCPAVVPARAMSTTARTWSDPIRVRWLIPTQMSIMNGGKSNRVRTGTVTTSVKATAVSAAVSISPAAGRTDFRSRRGHAAVMSGGAKISSPAVSPSHQTSHAGMSSADRRPATARHRRALDALLWRAVAGLRSAELMPAWLVWWLGDTAGMLIVAPPLMTAAWPRGPIICAPAAGLVFTAALSAVAFTES